MTMESDILLCHSDSSRRLHVVHIVNYSILSPPLGKKKEKERKEKAGRLQTRKSITVLYSTIIPSHSQSISKTCGWMSNPRLVSPSSFPLAALSCTGSCGNVDGSIAVRASRRSLLGIRRVEGWKDART